MFVVKDLRKIREICADEEDDRSQLKLARRGPEFGGNIKALCRRSWVNSGKFRRLEYLSLYGNELTSIEGIGLLSATPLKRLNLGHNRLKVIPSELGKLDQLEELWLDDNELQSFPHEVLRLVCLRLLRLSGNKVALLPPSISQLQRLQELALDRNALVDLPDEIGQLSALENIQLGGNLISEIPASLSRLSKLRILSVSSNKLCNLPDLSEASNLEELYAGANELTSVPDELLKLAAPRGALRLACFPNNSITTVRSEWIDILKAADKEGGMQLVLEGNPLTEASLQTTKYEKMTDLAYTQPMSVTYKKQKTS